VPALFDWFFIFSELSRRARHGAVAFAIRFNMPDRSDSTQIKNSQVEIEEQVLLTAPGCSVFRRWTEHIFHIRLFNSSNSAGVTRSWKEQEDFLTAKGQRNNLVT